ncbi:MAG TPA: hypothetical protein VGR35_19355 [Tepidisphaeraceae bacterium]|nr:hypothetical protein [Tepidisphaeraceae bacterium]
MGIAIEHEIVPAIGDEQARPFVVVKVEALEDVVASALLDADGPRLVHVGEDLLHASDFQPAEVQPASRDAEPLDARGSGELEEVEDGLLVFVREVVDSLAFGAALVEQDADGGCRAAEGVRAAANPDGVAGRDRLLRPRDGRERLGERAGILVVTIRRDIELAGTERGAG